MTAFNYVYRIYFGIKNIDFCENRKLTMIYLAFYTEIIFLKKLFLITQSNHPHDKLFKFNKSKNNTNDNYNRFIIINNIFYDLSVGFFLIFD